MNFPKAKWILGVTGCGFLVAMAFVFWPFRFSYTAVCTKCGAEQHVQEWKLPGVDWTFYKQASEVATPLSTSLTSSGLVTAHPHAWLFAAGGGNGIRCAIG